MVGWVVERKRIPAGHCVNAEQSERNPTLSRTLLVFAIAQPNLHFLNRQVLDFMVMFSGNQSIVESWQRLLNTGDD
jgi:hypothetical protein